MKWIPVLVIFLTTSSAFAQDTTLQRLLAAKEDTVKVRNLIRYTGPLIGNDNKRADSLLRIALDLSQRSKFWLGAGLCTMNIGITYMQTGQPDSAMLMYQKAITFFEKTDRRKYVGSCYGNIGSVHEMTGNRDSAILYYLKALPCFNISSDAYEIATMNRNIGVLFGNNENFEKALYYTHQAIDIARQQKTDRKSIVILIAALTDKSRALSALKLLEQAQSYASEAVQIATTLGENYSLAESYFNLSEILFEVNRIDSAISYARKAMRYAHQSGLAGLYLNSCITLSLAYDKKGWQKERQELLRKALRKSEETNLVVLQDDLFEHLADANFKSGAYKSAYLFLGQYIKIKDSILNVQSMAAQADAETRYKASERSKEITEKRLLLTQANLSLEKSNKQILYAVSGLLAMTLLATGLYLRSRYRRKAYRSNLLSLQKQKEIDTLQALINGEEKERSRIAKDLHDGVAGMLAAVKMHFGSIADGRDLTQTDGFQRGMSLLNEASQEIRKTAHNLMPEILIAHGLDAALQRYCGNISSSRLQVQYDSWGDITRYNENFELAIYRIVQELLHNVVKHSGASQAIVQLSVLGQILSLTVEDNGIGFRDQLQPDGTGIKSLQQRVLAMNGKMDIDGAGGAGVSAYLEFDTTSLEVQGSKATA
ncbi:tetratricopeptide repeat-containing sensor histidine kinase [Flavitalea antarctica]